jgi:hypothetical protein
MYLHHHITEMQQMMELLLAKMDADREERKDEKKSNQEMMARLEVMTDVTLKEMREEIKSGQAGMRSVVSAIEEKLEAAIHSMRA